jgi:hypothetical protein
MLNLGHVESIYILHLVLVVVVVNTWYHPLSPSLSTANFGQNVLPQVDGPRTIV